MLIKYQTPAKLFATIAFSSAVGVLASCRRKMPSAILQRCRHRYFDSRPDCFDILYCLFLAARATCALCHLHIALIERSGTCADLGRAALHLALRRLATLFNTHLGAFDALLRKSHAFTRLRFHDACANDNICRFFLRFYFAFHDAYAFQRDTQPPAKFRLYSPAHSEHLRGILKRKYARATAARVAAAPLPNFLPLANAAPSFLRSCAAADELPVLMQKQSRFIQRQPSYHFKFRRMLSAMLLCCCFSAFSVLILLFFRQVDGHYYCHEFRCALFDEL